MGIFTSSQPYRDSPGLVSCRSGCLRTAYESAYKNGFRPVSEVPNFPEGSEPQSMVLLFNHPQFEEYRGTLRHVRPEESNGGEWKWIFVSSKSRR